MFKPLRIALALLAIVAVSTTVIAEEKYAGLQYAEITYAEPGFQDNKPTALVGRIGLLNEKRFGIEGRFGVGLSDHTYSETISGTPYQFGIEVNSLLGLYGIVNFPATHRISFYGLAGLSRIQLTRTNEASGTPYSITEAEEFSYSYGFGGDLKLSESTAINIEYSSYLDEDLFDVTAVSAGVKVDFK